MSQHEHRNNYLKFEIDYQQNHQMYLNLISEMNTNHRKIEDEQMNSYPKV